MHVTYDPKADAVYIRLRKDTFRTEFDSSTGVALDYDVEGRLVGIEILYASVHFDDLDVIREMTFEGVRRQAADVSGVKGIYHG